MHQPPPAALTEFSWERQPEAERLVRELVDDFLRQCPEAQAFARRMTAETGTRFVDWVDYVLVPPDPRIESRLSAAGYEHDAGDAGRGKVWRQPHGVFPPIVVRDDVPELALKVDSVADFAAANMTRHEIEGEPLSPCRWLAVLKGEVVFAVIERHGFRGFGPVVFDGRRSIPWLGHLEKFRARHREGGADAGDAGFALAEALIDAAVADLGRDLACDAFFTAEREYWQRRNRAAQFQKARQDRLGLGWANHDHHTYRCSRRHFARLIGLWEKLGFQLRERFYAGAEAGWGAQVCEQPNAGIITFNDVDLSPEELAADFAHEPLAERKELGTVGLWCGLHGESVLQAGMHHLECQFDFDALREQMEREAGIKVMKPFTDFPHLRQAFTEGERWPVKEGRIAALLARGQITAEQAEKFRTQGAIGSHLENLERNEGFKGFNPKGVSEIIAKTDPRRCP